MGNYIARIANDRGEHSEHNLTPEQVWDVAVSLAGLAPEAMAPGLVFDVTPLCDYCGHVYAWPGTAHEFCGARTPVAGRAARAEKN